MFAYFPDTCTSSSTVPTQTISCKRWQEPHETATDRDCAIFDSPVYMKSEAQSQHVRSSERWSAQRNNEARLYPLWKRRRQRRKEGAALQLRRPSER